jgi:hypothetical protein
MPKQFEEPLLNQLNSREEIEIETQSATGRTHRTTIWVVVVDNNVYVRSVRGRSGRWYREITANPQGAIYGDGRSLSVRAIPVTDPATIARVSNAYLQKYRHSPFVNSMVREETLPTTLRLEPA